MKKFIVSVFFCTLSVVAHADSDGREFLGEWLVTLSPPDTMFDIRRNGEIFIVRETWCNFVRDTPETATLVGDFRNGVLKAVRPGGEASFVLDRATGHLNFGGLEFAKMPSGSSFPSSSSTCTLEFSKLSKTLRGTK